MEFLKDDVSQPARLEELVMPILEDSSTQQGIATSDQAVLKIATPSEIRRPRIQQVSTLLREVEKNRNCYDPRLVSFGPYHYGKERLKVGQTLKIALVQRQLGSSREIISRSSGKSIKDFFIQDFGEVADEARKCYDMGSIKDLKFDDQEFKCLMFLDGCFIVYFIHCIANNKQNDLKMKNDHIAFMIMDLFLLENQLPYTVLKKLSTTLLPPESKPPESKDIFERFVNQQTRAGGRRIPTLEDLYYSLFRGFIPCLKSGRKKWSSATGTTSSPEVKEEPLHLLDLLRHKTLDFSRHFPINGNNHLRDQYEDNRELFRSVQELKVVGISCICTGTSSPKDVQFKQNCMFGGKLSLPVVVVDDSTKTKWLNMVAYEACPDFSNDLDFTSSVCFMGKLINHAEDVKELRLQGVLFNYLGSDQNVADLFHDITKDLTPNPNAYVGVRNEIQRYFNNKCRMWIAEAWQKNVQTPWTTKAFFAGLFIIFLTICQTIVAVVQTYYQVKEFSGGKKTHKD